MVGMRSPRTRTAGKGKAGTLGKIMLYAPIALEVANLIARTRRRNRAST